MTAPAVGDGLATQHVTQPGSRPRIGRVLCVLCTALMASVTLAVMSGPVVIGPTVVWRIAFDRLLPGFIAVDWQPFQSTIVWDIRLPRVMLGALAGAGLAVVGATMQALVRNPLADPYLLGISSGAGLGAVSVLLFGATLGISSMSMAAFIGGLAATAGVYALASPPGHVVTERLVLAGVAVSSLCSSLTNLLIYSAPAGEQARNALFWLLGGLGGAEWHRLTWPAVTVLGGTTLLLVHARTLNLLSLGEESATTLGVDTDRARLSVVIVTALVTGIVVAQTGGIGFVGLMVPHVARLCVGADHRRLLPTAALIGAMFMIWVDVLARTILAPQEVPVGVITALIGAPCVIWLMRRARPARVVRS